MIEGTFFIKKVKCYFNFLETECEYRIQCEKINGNLFYEILYQDDNTAVSISYENIENYLLVIVFLLQEGKLPNYDDKTKTLHLNELNARIMRLIGADEINSNLHFFLKFSAQNPIEKSLLKSARELRLCLKHISSYKM